MGKNILKKTRYNSILETLFGLIVCIIFLSLPIVRLLSGENRKINVGDICVIIIFSICLLFYLWQIFAKIPQIHYVNINGWKYRSFQRMSKWKFIFISGFVNSILFNVMITTLLLSNLIKNDLSPLEVILIIIGLCIISAIPYGLVSYKKYAAVDMNS